MHPIDEPVGTSSNSIPVDNSDVIPAQTGDMILQRDRLVRNLAGRLLLPQNLVSADVTSNTQFEATLVDTSTDAHTQSPVFVSVSNSEAQLSCRRHSTAPEIVSRSQFQNQQRRNSCM